MEAEVEVEVEAGAGRAVSYVSCGFSSSTGAVDARTHTSTFLQAAAHEQTPEGAVECSSTLTLGEGRVLMSSTHSRRPLGRQRLISAPVTHIIIVIIIIPIVSSASLSFLR